MIREGKAKLDIEVPEKVSKKLGIFYNPVMKLNRDISIEVIKAFFHKKMPISVALPLAGSGVRGIRFLLEVPEIVSHVFFNDIDKNSVRGIMSNLVLSGVEDFTKYSAARQDAQSFLFESKGFDYIDVDPFGTPNPFLDAACQRIRRDGMLAVTATDTAPLSGTYPKVCQRNYDAHPLRNHLKHVIGLRILIRKIQLVAAQYEKALFPVFSYSKNHYFRVFLRCSKSKSKVNELLTEHKFLLYSRDTQDYSFSVLNDGGKDVVYAGKLYAGKLWDERYASKISLIKEIPEESSFRGRYYDIHRLSSSLGSPIPSYKKIMNSLKGRGFNASKTHFSGEMIKTDASSKELKELIQSLGNKV